MDSRSYLLACPELSASSSVVKLPGKNVTELINYSCCQWCLFHLGPDVVE